MSPRFVASFALIVTAAVLGRSQTVVPLPKNEDVVFTSVELLSPWDHTAEKTSFNVSRRYRSCVELSAFKQICGSGIHISYGNRAGVNWDILALNGPRESTSRMVDLGRLAWTDRFEVPSIQPWDELRPGESRKITIDVSGGDGTPGRNADGTYSKPDKPIRQSLGDKPLAMQVSSEVKTQYGNVRPDNYSPFLEAKLGHIYAVHIVQKDRDEYLLFRIDDLERGTRLKLSFRKAEPPPKPIY